ncbi:MAG: universal stress protein [Specibacter sp.]
MANAFHPGRIVVGVDGSPSSVSALREGARLAKVLGARVDAVACWDFPSIWAAPYPLQGMDFRGEAEQVLRDVLEEAFPTGLPDNVTGRLVQAQVRAGLMDASKDAAMLVVGRRGRSGFAGVGLGSVSSGCISHASCPVLVVHAEPDVADIESKAGSAPVQQH